MQMFEDKVILQERVEFCRNIKLRDLGSFKAVLEHIYKTQGIRLELVSDKIEGLECWNQCIDEHTGQRYFLAINCINSLLEENRAALNEKRGEILENEDEAALFLETDCIKEMLKLYEGNSDHFVFAFYDFISEKTIINEGGISVLSKIFKKGYKKVSGMKLLKTEYNKFNSLIEDIDVYYFASFEYIRNEIEKASCELASNNDICITQHVIIL